MRSHAMSKDSDTAELPERPLETVEERAGLAQVFVRSRHHVAAVDVDRRAGDVRGGIAGQEQHHGRDVFGLGEAAQRDLAPQLRCILYAWS
jgi:hypothetical protein